MNVERVMEQLRRFPQSLWPALFHRYAELQDRAMHDALVREAHALAYRRPGAAARLLAIVEHFERRRPLDPETKLARLQWAMERAHVLRLQGRPRQAGGLLLVAADMCSNDDFHRGLIALRMAALLVECGSSSLAYRWVEMSRNSFRSGSKDHRRWFAAVTVVHAAIAREEGNAMRALTLLASIDDELEATEDEPRLNGERALCLAALGRIDQAQRTFERTEALYDAAGMDIEKEWARQQFERVMEGTVQ